VLGICEQVPTQSNDIDCGVFVMKYAEMFCANPPEDMETFLPCLSKWFSLSDIPQKRLEVKNLILRLFAESKAELFSDDSSHDLETSDDLNCLMQKSPPVEAPSTTHTAANTVFEEKYNNCNAEDQRTEKNRDDTPHTSIPGQCSELPVLPTANSNCSP